MIGIKRLISRVFQRIRPSQAPVAPPSKHRQRPTPEEIKALPAFPALELRDIVAVYSAEAAAKALAALSRETVVGFDTESRPTFVKGEVSRGPHVVQFATATLTYVLTLHDPECRRVAGLLIHSATLKKVGFGLDFDKRQIPKRLHVQPRALIDLEANFRQQGYGRGVGVKAAVAIVFKQHFTKSRSATTSNWSRSPLTPKQLLYAANDAYAAFRVYQALKM